MKGLIYLTLVLFSYGIWYWKRRVGAAQLAAVESGKRCISCHSDQVVTAVFDERSEEKAETARSEATSWRNRSDAMDTVEDGAHIRCLQCGHLTDLAWLNRAQVDMQEMAEIARPDRR